MLLAEPLTRAELEALRERLRTGGGPAWAEELVDDALVRAPVQPEQRERFLEFLAGGAAGAAPARGPSSGDARAGGTPAGEARPDRQRT